MNTLFNCAGHNTKTIGASYFNTTEERQARETRDEVSDYLKEYIINVYKDADDASIDYVIKEINEKCNNGDVAIDIHFNASKEHTARGVEGIVYSGNAKMGGLCRGMIKRISDYTGMKERSVIYSDKFRFLNETKCDSIIIECGFLDSEIDSKIILDPKKDNLIAEAIADSIIEYYKLEKKENDIATEITEKIGENLAINIDINEILKKIDIIQEKSLDIIKQSEEIKKIIQNIVS